MKESVGAVLVAVLMIGLVAIAILMPAERDARQGGDLSSSPSGSLLGDTGGPFTALEKNDIRREPSAISFQPSAGGARRFAPRSHSKHEIVQQPRRRVLC